MDQQKRRALLEWVNSLGVGPCVEDLRQLKDIAVMCAIVRLMDADFSVVDEADEHDKLNLIVAILEERFRTSLPDKVNLSAALQGNEFEIAKLCLLLLVTSLSSTNVELFVERAVKLDPVVQFEIKEMVESVIPVDDNKQDGLNCSFFQVLSKSLSLTADQVANPQMSSTPHCGSETAPNQFSTPSHNSTPGRLINNRGTPSVFSTSIQGANTSILSRFMSPRQGSTSTAFVPMSPIHQLVHSPVISNKIVMQQKEQQIRKLKRELNTEQHFRMEAENELRVEKLNTEKHEQKISSLEKQLSKYRRQTLTLQEDMDRMQGVMQENQTLEMEILRKQNVSSENKELKECTKHLEKANTDMYGEVETLKKQVVQLQKYKESAESLEDSFCGLQTAYTEVKDILSSRETMMKTLEEENGILREDLLKLQEVYREKCEELRRRNEASLTMSGMGECLGDVVEIRYQEEIATLQTEVEKQVEQHKHLSDQLNGMQARNEEVNTDLATVKMESDQLKFEVNSSKEQIKVLCGEIEAQTQRFSQMEQEHVQLQNYCQQLSEELASTKEHASTVDAELTITRQDCGRLAQSLQKEKEKTLASEGKLQKLESIRERLNGELERKQAEKQSLEGELEVLKEENQRAEESLGRANGDLVQTTGDLSALKKVCSELYQEQDQTKENLRQTTDRLETIESDKNHLESQIFELQQEMMSVESRASVWQNMAEGFETQCKELEQKMKIAAEISDQKKNTADKEASVLGESLKVREVELNQCEELVSQLRSELKEMEDRATSVDTKLEAREGRCRNLEGELTRWEERCSQLEGLISRQQGAGSQLEEEVSRLKQDCEGLMSERGDLRAGEEKYRALVEEREALISQRDGEVKELQRGLQEKEGAYQTLCTRLESVTQTHQQKEEGLQAEVENAKGQMETLQHQLSEVEAKYSGLVQDLKERQEKAQRAEQTVADTVGKLREAEQAAADTVSKLTESEQDVYIWQDKYSQLDSTHFTLEQKWKNLSEQKQEVHGQCEKLEAEVKGLEDQVKESEKKYLDSVEVKDRLVGQCGKLEAEVKGLEGQVREGERKYLDCVEVKETLERRVADQCKELQALSCEGEGMQQFMDGLKQDKERLEREVRGRTAELSGVREKLSELSEVRKVLEAEVQQVQTDKQQEIDTLTEELDSLRKEEVSLGESIKGLECRNSELEAQVGMLSDKNTELSGQQRDVVKQVEELECQYRDSQNECERLGKYRIESEQRCNQLILEKERLEEYRKESEQWCNELSLGKERLAKEVQGYKDQLHTERSSLEGQQSDLQKQLNTVTTDRDRLQTDKSSLENQLCDHQKQLDTLTTDRNRLQTDRSSLENQLCDLQKQLDTLTTERNQLETERSILEGQLGDLQKQLNTVTTNRDQLQSERSSLESQLVDLQKQLDTVTTDRMQEKKRAEENIKALELDVIEGQKTLAETEEQCHKDLDMYEHRYHQSEQLAGQLKQQLVALSDKLESLDTDSKQKCSEYEGQLTEVKESLSTRLSESDREVSELRTKLATVEGNYKSLEGEYRSVQGDLDMARSASEEMQKYVESLQTQNREFRTRIEEAEEETEGVRNSERSWQEKARQYEMKCAEVEEEVYLNKETSQGKIGQFEDEMKQAKERSHQLQTLVDSFTDKVAALEAELREKKESYEQEQEVKADSERNHQSLLNVYKDKLASMDTHFEEYCQKVCKMEEAMRACHGENTKLKDASYRQQCELENRDEELRRERQRSRDLEDQCSEAEAVITALEDKMQGYEDRLQSLETTLNTTQVQTSHIEESFKVDLRNAHQKTTDLQRKFDQAESVIEEVKHKLLSLHDKLQQQDTDLRTTETKNKELTDRLTDSETENKKWCEKWCQIQAIVESSQERATSLECKLGQSRKEVESLEHLMESAEDRVSKLEGNLKIKEADLKVKEAELSTAEERTLQEVRECHKRQEELEVVLETTQNKNDELVEQCATIEGKYAEAKRQLAQILEQEGSGELKKKYNTLKGALHKYKDTIDELQKREAQFREVIDKYKTQQEAKNRELLTLKKQLKQQTDKREEFEQKYQERDVELGALRQQIREYELIHKTQGNEIHNLETQLDYASRQLRGGGHRTGGDLAASRRAVSARELSTVRDTVKGSITSEDDVDRSLDDGGKVSLYDLKSPRNGQPDFKTPSQPNLRKYPSNFSLASRHSSPTGSVYSLETGGPTTRSRSKLTSQFTTSTSSANFGPLRSADVPRGMGALLSSEDEPDVFEFNQFGRLSELQRRNTLCLPHMKSSYPVETQTTRQESLSDQNLKTGSTLEQMVEEVGVDQQKVDRRMTRKRASMDRLELDDSLETSKKKLRHSDEGVVKLLTPGVKLYKRYSPRLAERRRMTPGSRRFETQSLQSALEDAITEKGFSKASPLRGSRRSVKSNTPRKTPSSLRKIKSWTSRRKESSTSDENEGSKSRLSAVRESTSFQIGFSPVKSKGGRLRSFMSSKKESSSQVKKKPLKESNSSAVV